MIKPNYAYAKRQRDLAKKQRKQEKLTKKTADTPPPAVTEVSPPAPRENETP